MALSPQSENYVCVISSTNIKEAKILYYLSLMDGNGYYGAGTITHSLLLQFVDDADLISEAELE